MEQGLGVIPEQSHHRLNRRSTVPVYGREHYGRNQPHYDRDFHGDRGPLPFSFNRKSGFQALNNRASLLWLGPCCQLEGL